MTVPYRQIRGRYTTGTITVYQAYSPEIALPANAPYPLPATIAQRIGADPAGV